MMKHPMTHIFKNIVPRYLTTKEAARYIALSPRTLEKYRRTGEGPPFRRFGGRVVFSDIRLFQELPYFLKRMYMAGDFKTGKNYILYF